MSWSKSARFGVSIATMCSLYSLTKGQAAIIRLTRARKDSTGNLRHFREYSLTTKNPWFATRLMAKPPCKENAHPLPWVVHGRGEKK